LAVSLYYFFVVIFIGIIILNYLLLILLQASTARLYRNGIKIKLRGIKVEVKIMSLKMMLKTVFGGSRTGFRWKI